MLSTGAACSTIYVSRATEFHGHQLRDGTIEPVDSLILKSRRATAKSAFLATLADGAVIIGRGALIYIQWSIDIRYRALCRRRGRHSQY